MTISHSQDAVSKRLAVRIPEAIRLTGMGKTSLYALIASGDLTAVKIGRLTLIPITSLEALLDRNRQARHRR